MLVSIVIPVYNEEQIIEANVLKLLDFFKKIYPSDFQIIISDNASTDRTREIVQKLSAEILEIKYLRLEKKGKGLAVSGGWQQFPAEVYLFIDADLSCDLADIPKFINTVNSNYDLACGSRHIKNSDDRRPCVRRLISKIWNLIPKMIVGTKLTDTACGIKAANQKIINEILPNIKNHAWFFDTELALRAEKEGLKIIEIPVSWAEKTGRKSKVNFFKVGREYIKNLMRLKSEFGN